ncbi:MAG TPA: DUF72 domain-containing protein [Pyrinomonadaceae bacterium]|jgi:uncharacterized protein YecE (DUF72 family)|nr:DUF72 domain-containing protein [Pyrinomonadaceae bacterium]
MTANKNIRIGPAGWSYKDWEGLVYPQKPGAKFDPLEYLARFFDAIEINSSFYRPFTVSTAKSWASRVAAARTFKFTAKLHRVFTHERGKATAEDEKQVREGMDTLAGAGKLGAVLLQFPWSFKNTDDERLYLTKLLERFRDYPLALEVRHSSWNNPQIYEWLEELGVGFCNVDQPLFAKSIQPAAVVTSAVGYVRLHGRNYQDWFREKAPRDDRYNYLYSLEELEPWITRIKDIGAKTKESYVITNNHFRGQAVVNAIEIKATLTEERVPAPAPLFKPYPALADSATPEAEPVDAEPRLF